MILPGLALASAIKSGTEFAANDGCTSSTSGERTMPEIIAMSPTMLKLSLSKNVALTVLLPGYREQRVAVGRRAHDRFGCQIRARARPVLDYNRLPELLGEPLRD